MDETTVKFIWSLAKAAAIVAVQTVLIILVWRFAKRLNARVEATAGARMKPLTIKKLRLLSVEQMLSVILFLLKVAKWAVTAIQLFITLPMIFSLFPATEALAATLFGYIITPLQHIFLGFVNYIPNLITIIVTIVVLRYALKGLNFFRDQISRGRLQIPGFYAEWAAPTYNIIRILLYAFSVAVIFPYLPGSDSSAFQGISVFVGVLFSLGSSSAIGNLVAGIILTYMRAFKVGDRIGIMGYDGFVVEKSVMVLRIRTTKNEYITIPNQQVLQATITNYNTSSEEASQGLIIHPEITFNYSTPWRLIHEILLEAADKTPNVLKNPKPYILQTALDDFYCRYQLNCYVKEIKILPRITSALLENIQDGFAARGLDMTAPHYRLVWSAPAPGSAPPADVAAGDGAGDAAGGAAAAPGSGAGAAPGTPPPVDPVTGAIRAAGNAVNAVGNAINEAVGVTRA